MEKEFLPIDIHVIDQSSQPELVVKAGENIDPSGSIDLTQAKVIHIDAQDQRFNRE